MFIITNKMRRYLDKKHQENEIFLGQARILKYIYEAGPAPLYQRNVEEAFSIRGGSVSALLHSLVSGGFLLRRPSASDKRKKELALTKAGIKKAEQAINTIKEFEMQIENSLFGDEKEILEYILYKINTLMDKMEEEEHERTI